MARIAGSYARSTSAESGGGRVHVKLDSGMGRLGTRDADLASRVYAAARDTRGVDPVGLMTHFATADEESDDGFFARQLDTFARWVRELKLAQAMLGVGFIEASQRAFEKVAALNRDDDSDSGHSVEVGASLGRGA